MKRVGFYVLVASVTLLSDCRLAARGHGRLWHSIGAGEFNPVFSEVTHG